MEEVVPPELAVPLTAAYVRARYGATSPSDEDLLALIDRWKRLERDAIAEDGSASMS